MPPEPSCLQNGCCVCDVGSSFQVHNTNTYVCRQL
jgi:hypothetical protein